MFKNNLQFIFLSDDNEKYISNIETRLRALFSTPKGTMPLDREYGVDYSEFLDLPLEFAQNTFAVVVVELAAKYEPHIKIEGVEFIQNHQNNFGDFTTVIKIGKREAENE